MAFETRPNIHVAIEDGWKLAAENTADVTLQLLSSASVIVAIAAAAPSPEATDGFIVWPEPGRDVMTVTDLTTEKLFVRVLPSGSFTSAELALVTR